MKNLFLLLGLLMAGTIFGQNQTVNQNQYGHKRCSNAAHEAEAEQQDPMLSLKRQVMRNIYRQHVEEIRKNPGQKTADYVYRIPVVMHIMHDYGSVYNDFINNRIQYFNAVDDINAAFRNSDSLNIQTPFDQISHPLNIEFVLANKDPNGNLTMGVIPHQTPLTVDASNSIKGVVQWDNTKYLNIWIVRSIASGAGGWSHLPGIADNLDGIVMLNGQLGDLAHECGHWLGLEHPWGSTNDADLLSNCGTDDGVDDTPNTRGNLYNCTGNLTRNSCSDSPVPFMDYTGTTEIWPAGNGEIYDNVQNIMDYAFCNYENFTDGQKDLVRTTLSSSPYNGRTYIWTVTNQIETGICDTCGPYNFPPTAEFEYSDALVCAGATLSFTDRSYDGTPTSWLWDFGDATTSTSKNPTHSYSDPGVYTVKLTSTNSGGSSTETKSQLITVGAIAGGEVAPFYENFENGDFPTVADPLKEWVVENGHNNASWVRNTNASATGVASYSLKLSGVGSNYVYTMTSPTIDFRNASTLDLKYKYAYAPRYSGSQDQLGIYVSKNCGENWTFVYAASPSTMNTSGSTSNSTDYIPTAEEFQEQTVSLTSMAGQDNILIKFELKTGGGNYFYIDDINVGGSTGVGIKEESNVFMDVFPNPFNEDANINLNVVTGEEMELSIYNILGEQLYSNTRFFGTGRHNLKLSEYVDISNSGVYFVKIKSGTGTITKKLVRY